MSHEIDDSTGKPAFVFDAKEGGAWHGLGRPIPANVANDPAKIAEIAGAGYTVSKFPVSYEWQGKRRIVGNREALVRSDTGEALEILSGNKYNIVQPVEYFEAFRDSLAANHLRISSAGVLKGGRIVFVNAKLTDEGFDVLGLDKLESYMCLGGGYDGTMSSFGYRNTFRTVCWNTLRASLALHKSGKTLYRVPHSAAFDGKALGMALGLGGKERAVEAKVFNTLAGFKLAQKSAAEYFCSVLDIDKEKCAAGDISGKTQAMLDRLADAYLQGPGAELVSAKGTLWGALNAVTHYVDHLAPTRDTYLDGTDAARFASAQFGNGSKTKEKALELAMALAGIGQDQLIAA
jgi:phage/plasmid-like protein (TIGR03299 family)